ERFASIVGEAIDALVGPVVLRDAFRDDEAVALEASERRVDLAGVQRRQRRSEVLLQLALELIAMSRRRREHCQDRELHGLSSRYIYRVAIWHVNPASIGDRGAAERDRRARRTSA